MEGAAEAIKSELLTRDGATVHEHQFGSVVFRAAGEEIGHLHLGSAMADIHIRLPARLPAKTIKKLLSEGRVSCAPPPSPLPLPPLPLPRRPTVRLGKLRDRGRRRHRAGYWAFADAVREAVRKKAWSCVLPAPALL